MDNLLYRFPNEPIVYKKGSFYRLNKLDDYRGFIVSDFMQEHLYGFKEDERGEGIDEKAAPVVYDKAEYLAIAGNFLHDLRAKELGKAVLSRVHVVEMNTNAERIFLAMCEKYPDAFVYYFSGGIIGKWIGATPEVLVEEKAGKLRTMSLAGTKRAGDTTPWSEKEVSEQQMVTDYIETSLRQSGLKFHKQSKASEYNAGPVKHLMTEFLIEGTKDALLVAQQLHPTPAVSGLPVNEAVELIRKHERHDRELYSGFLGCAGPDTRLFVNLRCARIVDNKMYLFVGGGFTKDSDVEKEWEETENKAQTILNVMENL